MACCEAGELTQVVGGAAGPNGARGVEGRDTDRSGFGGLAGGHGQ
ncbi:hypothetical protein UO65_3012 [Actinokineospora spheciospongiae]|uniref:Uncharacterized protein n=1 Tax=Actinokineospora spheciospongiae TaxID=909613 RepID=W7J6F4_9PSEU|nr:hypothetical protein UO65_3012 [Actinokineospora spheciospongiae]